MRTSSVDELAASLEALRSPPVRHLIGIAGPPGSGKTHLARHLHGELVRTGGRGAARIVAMDGFHLPNAVLERRGLRARKGAPDTFDAEAFVALLRRTRAANETVLAPRFDRHLDEPTPAATTIDADVPIVIVEGNYLLLCDPPWSAIAPLLDLAVYVEASPTVRRARLLDRHERTHGSAPAAARWIEQVDAPNTRIVEATRPLADVVVDGSASVPGVALW